MNKEGKASIVIRQQTLLGTFSKHNGDVRKLVGIICDCVWANMDVKTTAVIFTPDHGGKGTGHGGKTMSEMQVPDIVIGAKIPFGQKINRIVIKYDNAPTIAYLLRLDATEAWYWNSIFAVIYPQPSEQQQGAHLR